MLQYFGADMSAIAVHISPIKLNLREKTHEVPKQMSLVGNALNQLRLGLCFTSVIFNSI